MLSWPGGQGGRPAVDAGRRVDSGASAEVGRGRMDDALPGDSSGGDTRATGPDLPGRGLPGDRNGGIVPYLSGEFVKSAPGERAGPAGALHLLFADPARRSAGAVRGRRDGTATAAAEQSAQRSHSTGDDDCWGGAVAGEAAVERRAGSAGAGEPERTRQ